MAKKRNEAFIKLLKEHDITAARLARRLGIAGNTVAYWTRGVTRPTADKYRLIADVVGVSVDEVVRCFIN